MTKKRKVLSQTLYAEHDTLISKLEPGQWIQVIDTLTADTRTPFRQVLLRQKAKLNAVAKKQVKK